jgi:hypothetical protein
MGGNGLFGALSVKAQEPSSDAGFNFLGLASPTSDAPVSLESTNFTPAPAASPPRTQAPSSFASFAAPSSASSPPSFPTIGGGGNGLGSGVIIEDATDEFAYGGGDENESSAFSFV